MADEQRNANVTLTADNTQYNQSMVQSTTVTNTLLSSVIALSNGMTTLASRAGHKLQIIGVGELATLTAATAAAARFDDQMSVLNANAVMTGRSYTEMVKQVNNLRGSFAVTTDQAVALQQQLRQMGQTSGVDKISETMLKLGAVTGESIGTLTSGLITLQRQMGTQGSGYTEHFASALANVSANAGVSASAVLDFSNAIAPVAKVAGISQKEVMGFSTAFVRAGQDGGAAATAFNRMLSDITRSVQYGSPELKVYSNLIGVSVDQFKSMPRAEAVTEIFDAISKQGPDAIKVLDQIGLDGIRTYKALQAVASQPGGIREAIANVNAGYDQAGIDKFNKAASASMDGLNSKLQILGNNLTMVGESFGSAFITPAKGVVDALTSIVNPLAKVLQMMGDIPGVAALGAAGMTILAGTIVRSLGVLTGLSLLRTVTGGTTAAGFRFARGSEAPHVTAAAQSYAEDAAAYAANPMMGHQLSWFQRRTFELGQQVGSRLPQGSGGGPGIGTRIGQLGAMAVQGLGRFGQMQVEGLASPRFSNPMNQLGRTQTLAGQGMENLGLHIANVGLLAKQGFGQVTGNQEMVTGAAVQRALNAATIESTQAIRAQAGFFATLRTESMGLARAMGEASLAAVKWGGSVALSEAPAAARLAGRGALGLARGAFGLGRSALGMLGLDSPLGAGLAAGFAGYEAYGSYQQGKQDIRDAAKNADATDAAGGVYRIALGEAAAATTTFADIVKRNASSIGPNVSRETPGVISPAMAAEAGNHPYTDNRFATMSMAEAKRYVLSTTGMSDQDRILMGYDLTKRFRASGAQSILDAQNAQGGRIDTSNIFSSLNGRGGGSGFLWLGYDQNAQNATKTAAATSKANLAAVQGKYGDAGAAQYTIASLTGGSAKRMQGGDTTQIWSALAAQLGIDPNDAQGQRDFANLFAPAIDRQRDGTLKTSAATFKTALDRVKAQPQMYGQLGTDITSLAATAGPGANFLSSIFAPSTAVVNAANSPLANITRSDSYVLDQVKSASRLGTSMFSGTQLSGLLVNDAYANPGNADIQQRASQSMAMDALKFAGSGNFAGAAEELQKFKAAAGSSTDQLYQLAQGAQAAVAQRQQEAMHYMSRSDVAGQVVANYQAAQRSAAAAQGTFGQSDAQANLETARQALEGQKASAYDYYKQVAMQERELNVQTARAQEDFSIQRARSDYNYNLGRQRSEDDFHLQRTRQEEQYGRQLTRNYRDYRVQRSYAESDFTKQRLRNEQDFQHQVVLMTEQASQQVYNIYERVNVARTWSADNLMVNAQDQLRRLQEQVANLATVRRAGVSSDVIKLLGLDQSANSQQLARFVADIAADPAIIKSFNNMALQRQKTAKTLVTDKDNTQWVEMERSFNLNATRAAQDFNISMTRNAVSFATSLGDMRTDFNIGISQAEADFNRARQRQEQDYNLSVSQMTTDFGKQLKRGEEDLQRAFTDIVLQPEQMYKLAMSGLTGFAAAAMKKLHDDLAAASAATVAASVKLAHDVKHIFDVTQLPDGTTAGGVQRSPGGGSYYGGGQTKAEGGLINGYSPHKKADNIHALLTAGEYVQPVDTVAYYGRGLMDALRERKIPKHAMAFADGGPVPFDPNTLPSSQRPLYAKVSKLGGIKDWEKVRANTEELKSHIAQGALAYDVFNQLLGIPSTTGVSTSPVSMRGPLGGSPAANAALGKVMAAQRGWTGAEFEALNWIYMHESGWNQFAQNPTSPAYGIPQALPGSKMASAGPDWRTNPATQISWGLNYIAGRYGDPINAQRWWKAHNWYGDGAIFSGGGKTIGVGERGPEMVLPLNKTGVEYLKAVMNLYATDDARKAVGPARGVPTEASTIINNTKIDKSFHVDGPVTVQAQDPREFMRKLDNEKRLAALTNPRSR